jgi:site-specific recombinase XerD
LTICCGKTGQLCTVSRHSLRYGIPQSSTYAVEQFLEETKLTGKPKTLSAYRTALGYFQESCHKVNLADIERRDLLKFSAFLRDEKDQAPRSVYNKFEIVMAFLKSNKNRGLVGKNDWPRYTEEEPETYEDDELDTLFAAWDAEERLWYEFFLMTGMRNPTPKSVITAMAGFGLAFAFPFVERFSGLGLVLRLKLG